MQNSMMVKQETGHKKQAAAPVQLAQVVGNQRMLIPDYGMKTIQRQVIVHGKEVTWLAGSNSEKMEKAIQGIIDQGVIKSGILEDMIGSGTIFSFPNAATFIDYFHSSRYKPLDPTLYAGKIRAQAIIKMTGTRAGDYAAAEVASSATKGPDETWHHVADHIGGNCTMVLIPTAIHQAFIHYGAVSQWCAANGGAHYG